MFVITYEAHKQPYWQRSNVSTRRPVLACHIDIESNRIELFRPERPSL